MTPRPSLPPPTTPPPSPRESPCLSSAFCGDSLRWRVGFSTLPASRTRLCLNDDAVAAVAAGEDHLFWVEAIARACGYWLRGGWA